MQTTIIDCLHFLLYSHVSGYMQSITVFVVMLLLLLYFVILIVVVVEQYFYRFLKAICTTSAWDLCIYEALHTTLKYNAISNRPTKPTTHSMILENTPYSDVKGWSGWELNVLFFWWYSAALKYCMNINEPFSSIIHSLCYPIHQLQHIDGIVSSILIYIISFSAASRLHCI